MKKVDILKVSFLGQVKRIQHPSKDVKCLANQIKGQFKELQAFNLTSNSEIGQNEFSLQWAPTADYQITVVDNDQLEEIYL